MRLKYTFETMVLDDRTIAVPVGLDANEFQGVVKLNETAAFILELLKNDTTEEAIVRALAEEYDAPEELLISDVHNYIKEFEERDMLVS